jgi:ABC-2 type transport system permease protein
MNKSIVVAVREYLSAVKSKGFLIGVILMPLLMGAGFIAQKISKGIVDTQTYRVAIVDRTPGAQIAAALMKANEKRDADELFVDSTDSKTGATVRKQAVPKFELIMVDPAPQSDPAAVDAQRLKLSDQCRDQELLAYVEIGEKVIEGGGGAIQALATRPASTGNMMDNPMAALAALDARPDEQIVRYSTNRPTFDDFRTWLQRNVAQPIFIQRMMKQSISMDTVARVTELQVSGIVATRGLATRSADGQVKYDKDKAGAIASILVPLMLLMLMFVVVFTGASPMATNVLEEKQMRIAEVLLGGLTPFQLMLGKLLGGVAVALTLAAIYVSGAVLAANQFDAMQFIKPGVLAAFVVFTILAVFMYGAVFLAAGAAVTNVKEVQAIIGPVMIFIVGPMALMGQIIEYPSGGVAKFLTWFPPTAPMVTVLRSAIPPGLPLWELLVGAISSIVGTLIIVWIGGRIFRIGLLSNSRPGSLKETIAWATRG